MVVRQRPPEAEPGKQRTLKATGELTLHGVTKTVQFDVTGQVSGSSVQAAGSIPITFADLTYPASRHIR